MECILEFSKCTGKHENEADNDAKLNSAEGYSTEAKFKDMFGKTYEPLKTFQEDSCEIQNEEFIILL